MNYSAELLHYFHHMDHAGMPVATDGNVVGEAVGAGGIDHVRFYSQVERGVIVSIRYLVKGRAPLMAACEYVASTIEGHPVAACHAITATAVAGALSLEKTQLHFVELVLIALKDGHEHIQNQS